MRRESRQDFADDVSRFASCGAKRGTCPRVECEQGWGKPSLPAASTRARHTAIPQMTAKMPAHRSPEFARQSLPFRVLCSAQEPAKHVVDGDADVRRGLKDLLESVGLRSKTFDSTMQFLQGNLRDEVSCLILDVRLPGLSGLDFQAELAAAKINIPIIFITGHGDIPMTVKAMKRGAVEFLAKPIREQDLLDAVRVALERDRERRERHMKTSDLRARFDT